MSAQFIIRYNGAGVRQVGASVVLGLPDEADIHTNEAMAWHTAYKLNLPDVSKIEVINRHLEQQSA